MGLCCAALGMAFVGSLSSSCFHGGYRECEVPNAAQLGQEPVAFSRADLSAQLDAAYVYEPRFGLWADGADKRRWIAIPEGSKVDNSNPEDWHFPEGTKLWKDFSLAGQRLETRVLHKTGPKPSDWTALAYVWNADGTQAKAAPLGAFNVHGTEHDVPSSAECMGCHGGRQSRVLGFSAVQLALTAHRTDHAPGTLGSVGVAAPGRGAWFTHPLPDLVFRGTGQEEAALGYLHANCSHCHNQDRPAREGARCYDPEKSFDLSLSVAALSGAAPFPAEETTQPSWLVPGAPDDSLLLKRMTQDSLFRPRMPNLGTEHGNDTAADMVRRWIAEMPRH